MTDKPKKYCDGIDCAFCSEKEPCIYKIANRLESELYQLKAKLEQEKALKETYLACYKAKHGDITGELFKLKVENERLKYDNEYEVGALERTIDNLNAEIEELKKNIMYKCPQCGDEYLSPIGASLYEENRKLKQRIIEIDRSYKNRQEELEQTLAEIKEIVEKRNYLDHNECLDDILQKISEVENDNA